MTQVPIKIPGYANPFYITVGFQVDEIKSEIRDLSIPTTLLDYPFLKAIEVCPPQGLTPIYLILFNEDYQPIGFYYFQVKYFKASESVRRGETENDFFCRLHKKLTGLVKNLVEFNTLVCGNLLISGPVGYFLKNEYRTSESLIYQYLIEEVQGWLRSNNTDTNVTLVKDFYDTNKPLENSTYHSFTIQPSMMMDIQNHWDSFDAYLEDLLSKYRVRAKRAIKAASRLKRTEINLEEIIECNHELYELYKQTSTNAEFNLFDLHPEYFIELKKQLGDQFHLYTYRLNGQLIAFFTTIEDDSECEAHFLGIDESKNKEYQIYLNILFEIIRQSIKLKKCRVRFSRTALEIKSSVGAIPITLTCYIKHRKVINNTFVPFIIDFLGQNLPWIPRHPFKEVNQIAGSVII